METNCLREGINQGASFKNHSTNLLTAVFSSCQKSVPTPHRRVGIKKSAASLFDKVNIQYADLFLADLFLADYCQPLYPLVYVPMLRADYSDFGSGTRMEKP